MKVKINVKTSPKTQEKYYEQVIAEAHVEMEAMFQENKDLRVSEGHLRDDLACAQALIAELNEQITAKEADAEFWKKAAAENAELASEAIAQVAAWERSTHEQIRELETELAELNEDYDALVQTKREYSECIDTLRQENKRLRNQMPLPEFMRQFIEMTREAVQNEFPDSGNS